MNDIKVSENELWRAETYDGTMKSLEDLVINLKLDDHEYHFNVRDKTIFIFPRGIKFRVGDVYQYRVEERFKVIK